VTLTRRLTLFFLAALASVLLAFSVALYLLADHYLTHQIDERLAAAGGILASAVEVEPDGVEWEPQAHPQALASGTFGDQLRWALTTDTGRTVDRSSQSGTEELFATADAAFRGGHRNPRRLDHGGQAWQVTRLRIAPASTPAPEALNAGKHAALVLTVAVPLDPVNANLQTLALTLVGLTLAILVVALVVARVVCRRALAPVTRMAEAAHSMGAIDLTERLPTPATGDELAELGQAFNGLLDRLAEALERERRFAGEASHQLRTPLAAVIGQVEVALRRNREPEEYRRVLESVLAQAGRLRRVAEALLFLARSQSEAGLPGLERVDLKAFVSERLSNWSDRPRSSDLRFELGEESVEARVQIDLFGELVDVLLDNAFKYSEPGTAVIVRVWKEANLVCLEVEDRGCGVQADELPHLFRPFFRSEAARRLGIPGAGLGLSVAARIATALGGSIEAESELGKGSRFRVRLPAVNESEERKAAPEMAKTTSSAG
jgi:signal transduction histidine kinase